MKIALVIFHADPARGGAERYTVDLAGALAAMGQEVSLVSSALIPQESVVRHAPELPYRNVFLKSGGLTRLRRYERFLGSLDAHLRDHAYDIVHAMLPVRRCDVYHPHAGIAADAVRGGHASNPESFRQSIAGFINSFNRKRRHFAAVEHGLLTGPHPPVVLCLSNYIRQSLLRHYSVDERLLQTLSNGIDLRRYDPSARPEAGLQIRQRLGIAGDRVVALMIAQDFQRKGLAEAIAGLARIEDDRLVLVVVGRPDPSPYQALAGRLGVGHRIVFAGATDDPCAFYQSADFFVLPTRHDPCSLVVLEALAMGLPVISTVQNGACEIMANGREGIILSDAGDIPALADAMKTLLDPARRQAMSQACLALRPRLSQEAHVDRLLDIYRGIRPAPQRVTAL